SSEALVTLRVWTGVSLFASAREFFERQLDGRALLSAPRDGFREFHVAHAGGEVGEAHRSALTDRVHKISLDAPTAGFLFRDGNLIELVLLHSDHAGALGATPDAVLR